MNNFLNLAFTPWQKHREFWGAVTRRQRRLEVRRSDELGVPLREPQPDKRHLWHQPADDDQGAEPVFQFDCGYHAHWRDGPAWETLFEQEQNSDHRAFEEVDFVVVSWIIPQWHLQCGYKSGSPRILGHKVPVTRDIDWWEPDFVDDTV